MIVFANASSTPSRFNRCSRSHRSTNSFKRTISSPVKSSAVLKRSMVSCFGFSWVPVFGASFSSSCGYVLFKRRRESTEKEKGIYEGKRNLGVTHRNIGVTQRFHCEAFLVDSGPPKPESPKALPDRAVSQQSASPWPEISGPWIFAF